MAQEDSLQDEPGPTDLVTMDQAVDALSYHLASGDILGSLANSLKTASTESGAVTNSTNGAPIDEDKAREIVNSILPAKSLSPAAMLKQRLQKTNDLIVCPGVYDGFSARIALQVGFDALYMVSNISSPPLLQCYSHELDRCRHNRLSPWTA